MPYIYPKKLVILSQKHIGEHIILHFFRKQQKFYLCLCIYSVVIKKLHYSTTKMLKIPYQIHWHRHLYLWHLHHLSILLHCQEKYGKEKIKLILIRVFDVSWNTFVICHVLRHIPSLDVNRIFCDVFAILYLQFSMFINYYKSFSI